MLDELFVLTFTANEFRQIPRFCLYRVGYNKMPHSDMLAVYFQNISIKGIELSYFKQKFKNKSNMELLNC